MAKKHLITTILIAISAIVYAQEWQSYPPYEHNRAGLNGEVKSIYSCMYKALEIDGEIRQGKALIDEEEGYITYHYQYNRKGDPTKTRRIDSLGEEYNKTIYRYNRNGDITYRKEWGPSDYTYENRRDRFDITRYKYDRKARLVETENTCWNTHSFGNYDAHNNCILWITMEYKDTASIFTYKYDENHRMIEKSNTLNDKVYRFTWKYDEHGNTIEHIDYCDNELSWYHYTKYDPTGKRIMYEKSGSPGGREIYSAESYHYNEDGSYMVKDSSAYKDTVLTLSAITFFDKDGQETKWIIFEDDGSVRRTHYYEYESGETWHSLYEHVEYNDGKEEFSKRVYTIDSYGNWTQCVDFVYDEEQKKLVPDEMEVREIRYYP